MNRVCWHPHDDNLIVSTSSGPAVLLHDLRRSSAPLLEMRGHAPAGRAPRGIYGAVFMQGGRAVVCAGEGSARISVYDAATGRPVGRGLVGFDASNLSVWTPTAGCEFLLASHDRLTSAFVCC